MCVTVMSELIVHASYLNFPHKPFDLTYILLKFNGKIINKNNLRKELTTVVEGCKLFPPTLDKVLL